MVKISDGKTELTVTKGAFHNFYERLGFAILDGAGEVFSPGEETTHPEHENTESEEIPQEDEDDTDPVDGTYEEEPEDEEIDLSEIPLSEQDFYQLQDYADQLGLDHRGLRSKKELRALIRAHLKG